MPPFSFRLRPLKSSSVPEASSPQVAVNKPRCPKLPLTFPENGNSLPSKRYQPLAFVETSTLWDRWQLGDAVVTVLEILGCASRNNPHQLLMIRLAALRRRIICEAFRDQLPPVQQLTITDLKRDRKNRFSSERKARSLPHAEKPQADASRPISLPLSADANKNLSRLCADSKGPLNITVCINAPCPSHSVFTFECF